MCCDWTQATVRRQSVSRSASCYVVVLLLALRCKLAFAGSFSRGGVGVVH
jgi:hypothetical protein